MNSPAVSDWNWTDCYRKEGSGKCLVSSEDFRHTQWS